MTGHRVFRSHRGPKPLALARRNCAEKSGCGRNVFNPATGKVETCTAPRYRLAGETMGCCEDCYNRTRPLGSVNTSYGRI